MLSNIWKRIKTINACENERDTNTMKPAMQSKTNKKNKEKQAQKERKERKGRRERKKMERMLWAGIRKKIKERDMGCVICGETKRLNVHHLIPKEFELLRYEPDNLICLCPKHHKYSIEISAHRNPFMFMHWLWARRIEQIMRLSEKYNSFYCKEDQDEQPIEEIRKGGKGSEENENTDRKSRPV